MLRFHQTGSKSFLCAAVLAVLVLISVPAAQAQFRIFVVDSSNNLLSFSSATPGTLVSGPTAITGLQANELIRGIDFRPADGLLYAIGTNGAAGNRLYTINTTTGAATQVGANFASSVGGNFPGVDFNPVVDRLRVISDFDNNLRVNPNDGTLAGTDTNVAYDASDANFGANVIVTGAAYTNNFAGAATTTLFAIDVNQDVLARVGSVDGTPTSPNSGLLFTIGALGVAFTNGSLDIAPDGTAFASEGDATSSLFTIDLATGAANFVGAIGAGNLTIDAMAVAPPGVLQFSAATASVAENAGMITLSVTRTGGSFGAVGATFDTSDGTALAGLDYTATNGVNVAFPDGVTTTQTVDVPIINDVLDEPSETFNGTLSAPTGGALLGANNPVVVTITDDDPPSITINDVAANEGTNAVFTVTLSSASGLPVSVNFATAAGTATAGSDFTTTSGTLIIAAGATTGTISVPVLFDAVADGGETFFVNLTTPVNATIADAQGVGTINDVVPNFTMTVTPASRTVLPGQSATYTVTITPTPFVPTVNLSCSHSIPLGGCSITPATVNPGSVVTTATLTVTTTGFFTVGKVRHSEAPLYAYWLPVTGFGAIGLVLVGLDRKRFRHNKRAWLVALLSLVIMASLIAGCAFGRNREDEGTPGGTYPVTVTGTGSGVTRTATVDLVVQGTN